MWVNLRRQRVGYAPVLHSLPQRKRADLPHSPLIERFSSYAFCDDLPSASHPLRNNRSVSSQPMHSSVIETP